MPRSFYRLWAAQSLSAFGNRITRTAIPIIAISMLSATPGQAALLSALGFAPVVAAGLFGGGLVERARKVRLMVVMDLLRFGLVLLIPISFYWGFKSFWLLVLISMACSAASALFQNADAAILPRLVESSRLVEANSRLQTTESLAELAGPGAAGLLVQWLTAPVAVVADAFTFLWSALWLSGIRVGEAPGEPEDRHPLATLRTDVVVGFRAVMREPALRVLLLATSGFYVSAGFFFGLYMVFALRDLGLSPGWVGGIISMGGLSALGGALLARTVSRWLGLGPAIALTFALGMLGSSLLLPAALWPRYGAPLLFAQQLLSDGAFMAHTILATSLRQRLLPPSEFARANGLFQAIGGFGMTFTTLLSGVIGDSFGVRNGVMIGAGAALISILPLLSPALLRVRDEPAVLVEDVPETLHTSL